MQLPTGELRSASPASSRSWKRFPRWRPLAAVAKVPGGLSVLEIGYRAFLPLRPTLAKVVGRFTRA